MENDNKVLITIDSREVTLYNNIVERELAFGLYDTEVLRNLSCGNQSTNLYLSND